MKPRDLINFMSLIEKLKCNTRHSWTSSYRKESVAEHSFRLAFMAYLMKDEFPELDISKVILMCICHDFGEAVTGDIPAFIKEKSHEEVEEEAIQELLLKLPEPYDTELKALFLEMKEQTTMEAKLYKALDKMETLIQHNESDLSTWLPQEYYLNLTYGEEQVKFSEYTKALKAEIDKDSKRRIEQAITGWYGETYHVQAVKEYNAKGCLIYCANLPGVFVRGRTEEEAISKIANAVEEYLRWIYKEKSWTQEMSAFPSVMTEIVQRFESKRMIEEAETEVLFESELTPVSDEELKYWKKILLDSARDFQVMYDSILDKDVTNKPLRRTFYGCMPQTPREIYEHVNEWTTKYFEKIGISFERSSDIGTNRRVGVELLLKKNACLQQQGIMTDESGEQWTVRKVIRRILWHERIHGKSLYKMAVRLYGKEDVNNSFCFLERTE